MFFALQTKLHIIILWYFILNLIIFNSFFSKITTTTIFYHFQSIKFIAASEAWVPATGAVLVKSYTPSEPACNPPTDASWLPYPYETDFWELLLLTDP